MGKVRYRTGYCFKMPAFFQYFKLPRYATVLEYLLLYGRIVLDKAIVFGPTIDLLTTSDVCML